MLYSIGKAKEAQNEPKLLNYEYPLSGGLFFMNIMMSRNQMAEWNLHVDQDEDRINDYYECLIECEDDHSSCKRICKEVLL